MFTLSQNILFVNICRGFQFPPISILHTSPSFKITTHIVRDVLARGLFVMNSSTRWKKAWM